MQKKPTPSSAPSLIINGKTLSILSKDGTWWIAIKPICDALGIEYTRAFKNLQEDDFFAGALAKQPMHDASNRLQEMTCICEKDVYGWLCSLRSESPALKEYKRKCYDILYQHFHGALTGRMETLVARSAIDIQIAELEQKMLESEEYLKIQELKKAKTFATKKLKDLDHDLLLNTQLSLFSLTAATDN